VKSAVFGFTVRSTVGATVGTTGAVVGCTTGAVVGVAAVVQAGRTNARISKNDAHMVSFLILILLVFS
jgi:integral membrane sensor domain MASE1